MSRRIKEIYTQAVQERNKRLELSEFDSDSKLSIMNGITWAFSTVIFAFESLLDVFMVDVSTALNDRINGTPTYYANALLNYQKGDTLHVREDGLAFGYPNVDESKRIITQVAYKESTDDLNLDSKLILKVATGEKGNLSPVSSDDLVHITAYINKIKFAGTRIEVVSLKGDVLMPEVTVYYDGAVLESEMYDSIDEQLNDYMMSLEFDSAVYTSKILEYIRGADHVTDVYIDNAAGQGIYIATYNSDGQFLLGRKKVERVYDIPSGYLRQSSCSGMELDIPNFRQCIKLVIDNRQ